MHNRFRFPSSQHKPNFNFGVQMLPSSSVSCSWSTRQIPYAPKMCSHALSCLVHPFNGLHSKHPAITQLPEVMQWLVQPKNTLTSQREESKWMATSQRKASILMPDAEEETSFQSNAKRTSSRVFTSCISERSYSRLLHSHALISLTDNPVQRD